MAANRPGPSDVLVGSISFLLSKLGSLTSSRFNAAVAPFGIHPGHYGLLRILQVSGPDSQQALGEALGFAPSRMVALVDELEDKGLVERRRSPTDRRVNMLHLTRKGRTTLAQSTDAGMIWQEELLANLSTTEREQLLKLLQRVAAPHHLTLGGPRDEPLRGQL